MPNVQRASILRKAKRLAWGLSPVALAACAFAVWSGRATVAVGPLWVILPALAFLAEFLPVDISRRGLRITFTLPYVAGMAMVAGPLGAILTEVLATTIVAWLRNRGRHIESAFLVINAAIAGLSSAAGVLATELAQNHATRLEVGAVAFAAAYAIMNFLLIAYVEWVTSERSLTDNVATALHVGLRSFLIYALLVTAVAVLVAKGMTWLVPLTLVPVWAIRTGLRQKAELYEQYYETITALTLMLQRAHPYTHAHLERVAATAERVARKMGLSSARARLVREAAVLHDVGKIAVDEKILDKPGRLTDEEMDHVRRHAQWGAEILSPVKGFAPLVPWIRHHHERPDGQGYPGALPLAQIPVESRIIAVVDAFDAMTDNQDGNPGRSYRDPMSIDEALEELDRCSGSQFDGAVVAAFREVVQG